MFSSAVWLLFCKSGLLSRIVQSRHSVLFVIVGVNKFVSVIVLIKLVTDLQSSTLMMASAQVVETSGNTNNSPQDYTTNFGRSLKPQH